MKVLFEINHNVFCESGEGSFPVPRPFDCCVFLGNQVEGDVFELCTKFSCVFLSTVISVESDAFEFDSGFFSFEAQVVREVFFGEVVSFLKLYAAGHAEESIATKYQPVLSALMQKWVDNFRSVLENLQSGMFLPQKVFLFMDGDLSPFFIKALREDIMKNSPNLGVSFDAALFSVDNLKSFLAWNDGVSRDSLIAVISLFASRVYQSEKK